jgi:hypothetical protein
MTFLWIGLGVLLLAVVVLTLADIIRRHDSVGNAIGWSLIVILLPFVGSITYWLLRKPSAAEVERERLALDDVRRTRAQRPFDSF